MTASLDERKFRWEKVRWIVAGAGGTLLFLIGLWQFTIAARNEFAKPVLAKQLELCVEVSELAALLAQPTNRSTAEWKTSELAQKYLAFYYGKLGVVEDRCLYGAMVSFKTAVFDRGSDEPATDESRKALTIAFACRRLLSRNWSTGLVGIYDPQELFEAFTSLEDFRNTMNANTHCRLAG